MSPEQLEFPFIEELSQKPLPHDLANTPFVEWPYVRLLSYEKDLRGEIDYYHLYEGAESVPEHLAQEYEDLLCAMNWQQTYLYPNGYDQQLDPNL